MTLAKKNTDTLAFGDFQTPFALAIKISTLVFAKFPCATTMIEPTCGVGHFLKAYLLSNPHLQQAIGWEINPSYLEQTQNALSEWTTPKITLAEKDFFTINWEEISKTLPEPILFLGNPPWVTNTQLSKLARQNLPDKSNFQNYSGLDAITGKSNFDVSEWLLIQIAQMLSKKQAAMAFLVKTAVARKVILYIQKQRLCITQLAIYQIDAKHYFKVDVDACLFYAEGSITTVDDYSCAVYSDLDQIKPHNVIGFLNNQLIFDKIIYHKLQDIEGKSEFLWRSGIKHDCAKIMEFDKKDEGLVNGLQQIIHLPTDYLYPLYKSSHIAKKTLAEPSKYMLVTQKRTGEATKTIQLYSPETWDYLNSHATLLDARKSIIYKNAPRFAIFGVGDYSFLPWKVAISGLYKNLLFNIVGSYHAKPIVFDDTCYFLSFDTEEKALLIYQLLSSDIATEFITSITFKDNKRPITVELLNRISLKQLAKHLKLLDLYQTLFEQKLSLQSNLF